MSFEVSAIPFWLRDDRFYRYIGLNFRFGQLDCDRFTGDIVIPGIVKSAFCSFHFIDFTITLAGIDCRHIEDRDIGVSLYVHFLVRSDRTLMQSFSSFV